MAEGLDEPLGLAVGSGRVGPGADVPEAKGAAGLGEHLGDIGRAVVAHHPPSLDPLAVEPGDGPAEKANHRRLLLVTPAGWHHPRPRGPCRNRRRRSVPAAGLR